MHLILFLYPCHIYELLYTTVFKGNTIETVIEAKSEYYIIIHGEKSDDILVNDLMFTDSVNFDNLASYDVADVLKLYFRELPECLLTNKLSHVFVSIFLRE